MDKKNRNQEKRLRIKRDRLIQSLLMKPEVTPAPMMTRKGVWVLGPDPRRAEVSRISAEIRILTGTVS